MMLASSPKYIANVQAGLQLVGTDNNLLPLVLGKRIKGKTQSYVSSPIAQYIDYGKREVELEMGRGWMYYTSVPLLNVLGMICHWGKMDHAIFVNNFLLSTNLYPALEISEIVEIRDLLLNNYPDRSIVFRSVNTHLNAPLLKALKQAGFRQVFSRQVYIIDPKTGIHRQKRALKLDTKLESQLEGFSWEGSESLNEADAGRILQLYKELYIRKYSPINPQFTETFFRESIRKQQYQYRVLRHQKKIVAVIGYYLENGVMTNPIIGYDQSYPKKMGLYRMLTLETIREAERQGVVFNMSSGASHFKRLRGAQPAMEYNLVYDKHLPLSRRLPWTLIKQLSDRVVIPIMQKKGL